MAVAIRNLDAPGETVRLTPAPTTAFSIASEASNEAESGCCGGAAPIGADACCALDAEVKATGGSGCGCGTSAKPARASGCC